jgi:hypothetical protein
MVTVIPGGKWWIWWISNGISHEKYGDFTKRNGDFTKKKPVISPRYGCDLNMKNGDVTINNAG